MIETYTPERTYENEPVQLELFVLAAFLGDRTPQRRIFTPWPAGAAQRFYEKTIGKLVTA